MKHIQLRSDTMTTLTKQMRESILTSQYGDWTYGEDQTVKELEAYAAQIFGAQSGAYVPSATFGNQCALFTATHGKPGQELLIRDQAHIVRNQNGSPGRIARLMVKQISAPFSYITPELLKKHLRKKKDSQSPKTGILVLEFPTFQGIIPPLEVLQECGKIGLSEGIHVHIDGARIFSAITGIKADPKDVMKYTSSITICLSKGLLAPVGSVVVGSSQFIKRFKINQKMMGGIFRKPGVVAGAGLIALKKMRFQVQIDNEMTKLFAKKLTDLGWFEIVQKVETTMLYFKITDESVKVGALQQYLTNNGVLCWITNGVSRFVIHHYIREPQIETVIKLLSQWKEEQRKTIEEEQRKTIEEEQKKAGHSNAESELKS